MADYYPLLTRAVAGLAPDADEAARSAIYARARGALKRQLDSLDPPLADAELARERLRLEEAIKRVEGDVLRARAAPKPTPPAEGAAAVPDVAARVPPAVRPPASAAAGPPASRPAAPEPAAARAAPAGDRRAEPRAGDAPRRVAGAAPSPAGPAAPAGAGDPGEFPDLPAPPTEPEPLPPVPAGGTRILPLDGRGARPRAPGPDDAEPARPPGPGRRARVTPAEDGERRPRPGVAAGRGRLVALAALGGVLVIGVAALALSLRGRPDPLLGETSTAQGPAGPAPTGQAPAGPLAGLAPDAGRAPPREAAPSPAPEPPPAPAEPKFGDRAADDAGGGPASVVPPPPAATGTATGGAAPAPGGPAVEAGNGAARAGVPVAQRATLFEEVPGDPNSARPYSGTVVWRLDTASAGQGQPLEPVLRFETDIPDQRLRFVTTVRLNRDATLPASHTVEMVALSGADAPNGPVRDVGALQFKTEEQGRGTPLAGLPFKVAEGFFVMALSNLPADAERNLDLLRNRGVIDLPIRFANGRRAVLTMTKGPTGERATAAALEAWGS